MYNISKCLEEEVHRFGVFHQVAFWYNFRGKCQMVTNLNLITLVCLWTFLSESHIYIYPSVMVTMGTTTPMIPRFLRLVFVLIERP